MVGAFPHRGAGVHSQMKLGAHHLEVVIEPDSRDQGRIVRRHEQGQRLRQSLQQHLMRRVDGQQPYPGHVFMSTSGCKARRLQTVAKHFVQGELSHLHFGEPSLPEVQPEPYLLSRAIEPVRPVGVHVGRFNRQFIRRIRTSGLSYSRFKNAGSVRDRVGYGVDVERSFSLVKLGIGIRPP
jgi:hypothetical protein